MLAQYCKCGAELHVNGERLGPAVRKLRDWKREHWEQRLEGVKARAGHGPCSAVEAWQARQSPQTQDTTPVILAPVISIVDMIKRRDRDDALPIEPETRGRSKLFKT